MKARIAVVATLLLVVVFIAWNALFFGPAGESVDKAKRRSDTAQQTQTALNAQLRTLRAIAQQGPEFQAKLDRLNSAVPVKPDLEGFIRSAQDLKVKAGVDWVSIQPATPAAGSGPSEIRMQIVVSGGFFQVLDYLNRLEGLQRIVIVDTINVAAASENSAAGSSSTPTTTGQNRNGAPNLTVTLSARMFTQAVAVLPPGAARPKTPSTGAGATTTSARTPATAGGNT